MTKPNKTPSKTIVEGVILRLVLGMPLVSIALTIFPIHIPLNTFLDSIITVPRHREDQFRLEELLYIAFPFLWSFIYAVKERRKTQTPK